MSTVPGQASSWGHTGKQGQLPGLAATQARKMLGLSGHSDNIPEARLSNARSCKAFLSLSYLVPVWFCPSIYGKKLMLSAQEPRPDAGRFWRTLLGCLGTARGSWGLKANDQGSGVKHCQVVRPTATWSFRGVGGCPLCRSKDRGDVMHMSQEPHKEARDRTQALH